MSNAQAHCTQTMNSFVNLLGLLKSIGYTLAGRWRHLIRNVCDYVLFRAHYFAFACIKCVFIDSIIIYSTSVEAIENWMYNSEKPSFFVKVISLFIVYWARNSQRTYWFGNVYSYCALEIGEARRKYTNTKMIQLLTTTFGVSVSTVDLDSTRSTLIIFPWNNWLLLLLLLRWMKFYNNIYSTTTFIYLLFSFIEFKSTKEEESLVRTHTHIRTQWARITRAYSVFLLFYFYFSYHHRDTIYSPLLCIGDLFRSSFFFSFSCVVHRIELSHHIDVLVRIVAYVVFARSLYYRIETVWFVYVLLPPIRRWMAWHTRSNTRAEWFPIGFGFVYTWKFDRCDRHKCRCIFQLTLNFSMATTTTTSSPIRK